MNKIIETKLKEIYGLADKYKILEFKILFPKTVSYLEDENEWEENISQPSFVGKYEPYNFDGPQKFSEELEKLLEIPASELGLILSPYYYGSELKEIKKSVEVKEKKLIENLQPFKGFVTLFHIWKPSNMSSANIMKREQEIIEKHADFVGKVKLISICIDDKLEDCEKTISQFPTYSHYWVDKEISGNIHKIYPFTLPISILTDQNGKIVCACNSSELDLEDATKKLISGQKYEEKSEKFPLKDSKLSYEMLQAKLNEFSGKLGKEIQKISDPNISAKYTEIGMKNGDKIPYEIYFEIGFSYTKKQEEIAKKIKSGANEILGKYIHIKLLDELEKTGSVSYGSKCSKCNKSLGQIDQYQCVCCNPPAYFCTSCIPFTTPIKTTDLVHPHPLYFIQTGSKSVLEEIKVTNIKPQEIKGEMSKNHSDYTCEICENDIKGIHWKCANCEAFDLCNKCFEIGRDEKSEKYAEICEKAEELQHSFKTHIYIREDFEKMYEIGDL